MAHSSVSTRIVEYLFPTFSGKVHGAVSALLLLHLTSVGAMWLAGIYPAGKAVFLAIGATLLLLALVAGFLFARLLKTARNAATDEITALFQRSDIYRQLSLRFRAISLPAPGQGSLDSTPSS